MQKSDIEDFVRMFADPKVMASFDVAAFDRSQLEHWIHGNLVHQNNFGYGLFSVILKTNGLLIGNCGLQRMEIGGVEVVELGYEFRSDYWNKGYATEAAGAVRDFAFQQLHLPRLTSLVRVGNLGAMRVSEKIGMSRTGDITHNNRQYWQYFIDRNRLRSDS
jgi:RimJ/RimL family protein N-acetyltransferase